MIHPVMSQVFTLDQTGEAAYQVHNNMHEGKIGVDWRGSSFRRRRNVTAELPKDGRGSEWIGVDRNGVERLFFPQSQKCDGGTSKGREWTGREWIGKDGRGREGI